MPSMKEMKFVVDWRRNILKDDDIEDKCIMVMWNDKNEMIDNIMNNELNYCLEKGKKNLKWLKNIRDMTGLTGTIYLNTKQNTDGYFMVWINNWEDYTKEDMEFLSNIKYDENNNIWFRDWRKKNAPFWT